MLTLQKMCWSRLTPLWVGTDDGDEGLYATGTLVKVDHPKRGKYISVGCPIKLSASPAEVTRSPLLGEHTAEILSKVLGFSADEIDEIISSGAVGEVKAAAE